MYIYRMLKRDAEGRKKEESKAIQTTTQSNTAHVHEDRYFKVIHMHKEANRNSLKEVV